MQRILVYLVIVIVIGTVDAHTDDTSAVRKDMIKLLLSATEELDPRTQLMEYSIRRNIPINDLVATVEGILGDILAKAAPDEYDRFAAGASVAMLGQMGYDSSLAVLGEGMTERHGYLHTKVVRAYVRIARADSLEFARNVVENRDKFHFMVRYILYESLAKFAVQDDASTTQRLHTEVVEFLFTAIEAESRSDIAKQLDSILATLVPEYRTSIQRERVAEKFIHSPGDVHKDYFRSIKAELQSLPSDQRKTLNGHSLNK
jgi:hypothetical protein